MAIRQLSEVIRQLRRTMLLRDEVGMTDGQLLESFISHRDEAALEALVRRHAPMVWSVCRRILPNHHDAEDAFQATFLVLVRQAASIVPREMVTNWLYGVAHRTALKARATAAKRRLRERQVIQMPEPAVAEQGHGPDLQAVLDQELSRLPGKYRVVIVLCDLEEKTRKEAARQLGLPEGTVASRLMRARTMLAKRLIRRGLAVSGGTFAAVLTREAASACVPPPVVSSTIKAAILLTADQAATAGVISAKVAALTGGVLKTMMLAKLKLMMLLMGTLGVIALGLGLSAYHGLAQQSANENKAGPIQRDAQEPPVKDADKSGEMKSEPHYCWLVFGPKKVRALMRLKGDEVAVDRDGDGKFDSKGERFLSEKDCKDVVIADPNGKTSYVITNVHVLHIVPPDKFVSVRVNIRGKAPSYAQEGLVKMEDNPKAAPQAHFYGPLTVTPYFKTVVNRVDLLFENDLVKVSGLLPESVRKRAGLVLGPDPDPPLPKSLKRDKPTTLFASLATDGENSEVVVCSPADTDEKRREVAPFPKGVHPFVDVEFPAKQPGGQRIKRRYPLDKWNGCGYRGSVSIPADAGVGKAKVTFSFDAWKGIKATPTTVEIPVDAAK